MNNKKKPGFRTNPLDISVVLLLVVSLLGFLLARAGHAGVNHVLKGQTSLSIDLYLPGVKTLDQNLFKVGDKAALTIRNQPVYPPFTITSVKRSPRLISFLASNGKLLTNFIDPAQPYANDYLITITDQAELTTDGYVIHGNKIKVGNQIEIEGFKYRIPGTVLDLRPQ